MPGGNIYKHLLDSYEYYTQDGYYNPDRSWDNPFGDSSKPKECEHEWKQYVGFTETYTYCKKCDKKEEKK